MPDKHAVLSASSAHRWLVCTAAPRYEEQFPAETSVYAQEGTLAHSICELMARKRFTPMSKSGYDAELEKLKADPLFLPEMLTTAEFYVNFLTEKANTYDSKPYVALEVVVDYAEWVPEGFGTCDCVMIGGDTLRITDYKHGKGEVVSAVGNPQMRLYALGALRKYRPLYGDAIQNVAMAIVQPRVTEDCSEEVISVKDLLDWGESIKPVAMQAFSGILVLTMLLQKELKKSNKAGETSVTMSLSKKIDMKKKSNGSIRSCYLYMNAHYFTQREAIFFNEDGFIGFAGWADVGNKNPLLRAFLKWCDYMTE